MSASRKEKIASSFIDVQLSAPESKLHSNADRYRFNEYSSSQSVAGVLQRPPHYSSNLTSAVYRQRSTLSSKGVTVLQKQETIPEIQKDSFLLSCTKEYMPPLSHDSDSEYDTDLEEDFPPKRCPPPTHSNPRSQVDFYKAVCSRVGIIPISSYEKNIDKEECILNYRKINGVESKALSLPLQVSKQLILEMQREDNSN
ncbi:hypothetical protein EB796_012852 [Bugula neritina]|uniref:Uncharacterized protein n=1 Tax=Bugula neritina TaxID=10212 RepID=A0A7J7JS95_BUGNE|nr:hypothetical protein EB796_012852 [Bugula neritina]